LYESKRLDFPFEIAMKFNALELAAAPVRNLSPYLPGKPLSELEREYGITDSIKLASNENPLGPGPKAKAAIAQAVQSIGRWRASMAVALSRLPWAMAPMTCW
jgi:histidinol-phosphate/aromatic aminotransferase/cobyric acid decarboxylase-like protein